jgi:hypothetical protein
MTWTTLVYKPSLLSLLTRGTIEGQEKTKKEKKKWLKKKKKGSFELNAKFDPS